MSTEIYVVKYGTREFESEWFSYSFAAAERFLTDLRADNIPCQLFVRYNR